MKKICISDHIGPGIKKLLLTMKLTIGILVTGIATLAANSLYSQNIRFNLDMENTTLKEVFMEIESTSEFVFIYYDEAVDVNKKVSINAKNKDVYEILNNLFQNTTISYKIVGRQIILFENTPLKIAISRVSAAELPKQVKQQHVVSGKILDSSTGDPLPGVNIVVEGTTTGTITDLDGNYTLSVPSEQSVLVYSYVGYLTEKIAIDGRTTIDVTLVPNLEELEEVVVVGYGLQKKESVVGAISTTQGDELLKAGGATTVSNTLSGLLPGMVTINTSGKPGEDEAKIIIRGVSTWNNTDPLILVDGVERDMDDINISAIESISMLKDASATAVFGVRGANGVILITTKRGKEGKPVLRFGANTTVKSVSKVPEFVSAYDSRWMRNEIIESQVMVDESSWAEYTPNEILEHYKNQDQPYLYPDVDWQDLTLNDHAYSQRYTLDLQGGTEFVKYFAAVSYLHDGDMLKGDDLGFGYEPSNDYSRLNLRTNLDFAPTKSTTISVDIDGAFSKNNRVQFAKQKFWRGLYGKAPDLYPVFYEDGILGYSELVDPRGDNMYYAINYSGMTSDSKNDINTTFKWNQKLDAFIHGLSLNAKFNYQNLYRTNGPSFGAVETIQKYIDPITGQVYLTYPDSYTNSTHGFNFVPDLSRANQESVSNNVFRNMTYQVSLNYSNQFGKHEVGGLALFQRLRRAIGSEFPSFREEWAGRLTYAYDDKYLLEGNVGYNGSENFGDGYKFGLFPSFALGWLASNEAFIKDNVDFLSLLKFRFSSGIVGSDNGIPRWLFVSSWVPDYSWRFGIVETETPYQTFSQDVIGNPNARWETAVKNNLAVETGFFSNVIRLSFDYFWGKRRDIFMSSSQRNIPPWFGAKPVAANLGSTKEQGFEIDAKFNNRFNDFRFFINANMSYVTTKVNYREDPELLPDYQKAAGFPIGQVRTIMHDEIVDSWDEMYTGVNGLTSSNSWDLPGDYRLVDYNADGIIDNKDVVPFGYSSRPELVFSIAPGIEYKNFDFSIQFYGMTNYILNQDLKIWGQYHDYSIDELAFDQIWFPGREESATFRRPTWKFGNRSGLDDGHFNQVDGTIWRIKTAEIAYTLQSEKLVMGIDNIRIYLNGTNLWLYNHLNEDRDRTSTRDYAANDGFDAYPILKSFNLGINVTF